MPGRSLNAEEQQAAASIFSGTLNYTRIRVYEQKAWPLFLARFGAWLTRSPRVQHNGVALGNRLFFSRSLRTGNGELALGDMSWLMHELTHCWQYQHGGVRYLFQALAAQLTYGSDAYDYGGEQGLRAAEAAGKHLKGFNPEQQADIVRHFYERRQRGEPCDAWLPFIGDINPHIHP